MSEGCSVGPLKFQGSWIQNEIGQSMSEQWIFLECFEYCTNFVIFKYFSNLKIVSHWNATISFYMLNTFINIIDIDIEHCAQEPG